MSLSTVASNVEMNGLGSKAGRNAKVRYDQNEGDSADTAIVLTARIRLRPCDKPLRDRADEVTEIELVLHGTAELR
jgi:hypothetical protein